MARGFGVRNYPFTFEIYCYITATGMGSGCKLTGNLVIHEPVPLASDVIGRLETV